MAKENTLFLTIDPQLNRLLKIVCAIEGMSKKEFVSEMLAKALEDRRKSLQEQLRMPYDTNINQEES